MRNIAYIFVLLASLLWGSIAAVGKLLLADLSNLQVLLFNNLFAFFGLLAIVLFQRKIVIIRIYTKQDYLTFAWMGLLGVFFYAFFLYSALQLLPAQEAFIINYLWPVMVMIFAMLILKEEITWRKGLGIICSFIGVVILITRGNFSTLQFGNILGILSAIAGAVVYGLFSVLGKKQDHETFTSMMAYYFFSIFYALIAVLLFSEIPQISPYQLAGLLWLGTFTSGLGFVFWFLALRHGDTAKMANMIFLTPFISLVYIYFLVGEEILVSSVVGLVIIVIGIMIQSTKEERNLTSKKKPARSC
jgi:drug/metabolite transporter (DMT)-like permease